MPWVCSQVASQRLAHSLECLRNGGLSAISIEQLVQPLHAGVGSVINTRNRLEVKEYFSETSKMKNEVD